jgi:hypothetical protein
MEAWICPLSIWKASLALILSISLLLVMSESYDKLSERFKRCAVRPCHVLKMQATHICSVSRPNNHPLPVFMAGPHRLPRVGAPGL